MKCLSLLIFQLFLLISLYRLKSLAHSPPISVSIRATWDEPPLLIQILESATIERSSLFFLFLDAVCSRWPSISNQKLTDQKLYESLLSILSSPGLLDGPGELQSLEMSLALKEAQPKIEAFRAWYASLPLNTTTFKSYEENGAKSTNNCESWVEIDRLKVCDVSQLTKLLESDFLTSRSPLLPQLLPLDHNYGPQSKGAAIFILYASDDPNSFGPFHKILMQASKQLPTKVAYIFRWTVSTTKRSPSFLSGWGAGLDIKKSEYLTLDDRPVESVADDEPGVNKKNQQPENISVESPEQPKLKQLKSSDIVDIGCKAAQHVLSSPNPLSTLRDLSENFPKYANTLVSDWIPGKISHDLREEIESDEQSDISPGASSVWMNGLELSSVMPLENLNFFKLIELMRSERHWMMDLASLGLSVFQARRLITDKGLNLAIDPEAFSRNGGFELSPSVLGQRFDASDRPEQGGAIIWFNDLESDSRYIAWPKTLRAILRPTFPGQLHALARNLITVVLALDLTETSSFETLGNLVEPFITRQLPIRWGFVPISSKDSVQGELISKTFWNLTSSIGSIETLKVMQEFISDWKQDKVDAEKFSEKAGEVISAGDKILTANQSSEEEYEAWLQNSKTYITRLALCSSDDTLSACMLINGRFFPVDADIRSNLQQVASLHTQFIQHQVYFNFLQDDADVANYLYDLPNVHQSRNDLVLPSENRPLRFINVVRALDSLKPASAQVFFKNAARLSLESDKVSHPTLIWLVGNLDSDIGVAALAAVLDVLTNPPSGVSIHVSFVHLTSHQEVQSKEISTQLAALLSATDSELPCDDIIAHLARRGLNSTPDTQADYVQTDNQLRLSKKILGNIETPRKDSIWDGAEAYAQRLGLKSDDFGIVINGRIITLPPSQKLRSQDISMLVEYEADQRIKPLMKRLEKFKDLNLIEEQLKIPLIMSIVGSVLMGSSNEFNEASSTQSRSVAYLSRPGHHSSFKIGDEKKSLFEFGVVLNPVSETAQEWSALLETLSQRSDIAIKVWLNPSLQVSELPIKRFFRTAIPKSLEFDTAGNLISHRVNFQNIPTETLLTLTMVTPTAWLALPRDSVHDLDNIMLSDLPPAYHSRGVEAVFQLDHIIVAGHAREIPSESPPRGLQIVLTDLLRNREVDTIIMANLGYFQFKSAPGLHRLTIRPGRSSELYEIETVDSSQKNSPKDLSSSDADNQQVCLTTFNGLTLFPRFRKRPDKIDESLIQPLTTDTPSANTGPASEITKLVGQFKDLASGMLGNKVTDVSTKASEPVINIFTVASGLLYERMAYLMCISVMRHTKSPVKFWFISNFLSPSFTRFIPHLAREYGFDYQLVTYRWPPWLRAQKEKQRVIWGYKILFLDVLFPLEIDRVIFVDSDQIVRTDMKGLVELDLRGAPYAYTPMCNDRNETKGFRFWDSGYWKESLQGRPYHISALYVVDLRVFRAVAAGDQLRQHYQALSADPSSLANLDQDLPNNMQSVLPIFSLDQSWLWCETWCSDEGLKSAKTIDLCNNPLTHEPKLQRAKRIIPEWEIYDQEVAALALKVKKQEENQNNSSDDDSSDKILNIQHDEKVNDKETESVKLDSLKDKENHIIKDEL
ncbi:hypothetical protein O181_001110 [Austropuccinia psidii MF-1]|uniref:UDP-glucose:glycoprotein glucosyltransferase n=1 Tax=Austropuccinia psidii MF-1 TaxID=1389203 RepID=A0A9Q3GBH9_9BASI|nr:hypothetical protein [Austropuccinia psidii MF-1]